jgi:hypothetical protein
MATEFHFKTSVCPEYECLLLLSKTALDDFTTKQEEISYYGENNNKTRKHLLHLFSVYQETYSKLMLHFDGCEVCQYISKLGNARSRDGGLSECESNSG